MSQSESYSPQPGITAARNGHPSTGADAPPVQTSARIDPAEAVPAPSWGLDRLAGYAKGELSHSAQADREAILQAHKSAVHLFRAGCALALAREKCRAEKHGSWAGWKREHGLADTSVNDAIRLFENAKTEEALAGLGVTQAKEKYVYPAKGPTGQSTLGTPKGRTPQTKKRRPKTPQPRIAAGTDPTSATSLDESEAGPGPNEQSQPTEGSSDQKEARRDEPDEPGHEGHEEAVKLPCLAHKHVEKEFGLAYTSRELMYQCWFLLQDVASQAGALDWSQEPVEDWTNMIPEMRDYILKIEDAGKGVSRDRP